MHAAEWCLEVLFDTYISASLFSPRAKGADDEERGGERSVLGAPNAAQLRESVHACHLGDQAGYVPERRRRLPDFSDFFFFIFPSEGGMLDCLDFCGTIRFFNLVKKKRKKREGGQVAHCYEKLRKE